MAVTMCLRYMAQGVRVLSTIPIVHPVLTRRRLRAYALRSGEKLEDVVRRREVLLEYAVVSKELVAFDCNNQEYKADMAPICDGRCGYVCLASARNCKVFIDEIMAWAPARSWHNMPVGVLSRIVQVRHGAVTLLYTGQHESQVDKAIRQNTVIMWHCHSWFQGLFYTAYGVLPAEVRDDPDPAVAKRFGTKRTMFHRTLAEAYSSFAYAKEMSHLYKRIESEELEKENTV